MLVEAQFAVVESPARWRVIARDWEVRRKEERTTGEEMCIFYGWQGLVGMDVEPVDGIC